MNNELAALHEEVIRLNSELKHAAEVNDKLNARYVDLRLELARRDKNAYETKKDRIQGAGPEPVLETSQNATQTAAQTNSPDYPALVRFVHHLATQFGARITAELGDVIYVSIDRRPK